jgi:hypothetical protein
MPSQLPSGRWRTRIRHPRTGRLMSAHAVIGGPVTYEQRAPAVAAEHEAHGVLCAGAQHGVTVAEFWHDWTTDLLWQRPSESTNMHNRERTVKFATTYGARPMRAIDDGVVIEWLRGGKNAGTVPALRAMFNDAMGAPPIASRVGFSAGLYGEIVPRGRRDLVAWAGRASRSGGGLASAGIAQ